MALPAIASAQTLNFDDVNTGGCDYVGLGTYGGFNWSNAYVENGCMSSGNGYVYGVVSSPNALFNGFGTRASFSSSNPFTFNSVYATDAFTNETVTFRGWLASSLLYTSSFNIMESAPTLLTISGWGSVDKVDFCAGSCNQHDQVVLDNLTVNGTSTVTPEPATLLLLGTGLAGIGGIVRRRRQQNG